MDKGELPTDLAAMLEAVASLMGEEFAEAMSRAIDVEYKAGKVAGRYPAAVQ